VRWIKTDTGENVNISSATAIGTFTADHDMYVVCDVTLYGITGGGDYILYTKRQLGGAGDHAVVLPKATLPAATGETAISGQSGVISLKSGDVVTVYIDGLAGDTTTPDYITRWFEAGVLVTLADDAITASVYDENTAFPIKSADTGATQIARVGADSDTLETLSDQIDGISGGSGGTATTYTVTDSSTGLPIADVHVWVSTDTAGANVIASGYTDASGEVVFMLDSGTYYVWSMKAGYNFTNPDTEVVA